MKTSKLPARQSKRGRYLVAMVLGTALSTMGSAVANVAQPEERAVNPTRRYCTTCRRNARLDPSCWPDCTQEVFCRLMERVSPEAWGELLKVKGDDRREFLRAIDAVKKRSQRTRRLSQIELDTV